MSAPKTDVDKQEKRHRHALLGIKACLVYAAILLVAFIVWLAARGDTPEAETMSMIVTTAAAVATL